MTPVPPKGTGVFSCGNGATSGKSTQGRSSHLLPVTGSGENTPIQTFGKSQRGFWPGKDRRDAMGEGGATSIMGWGLVAPIHGTPAVPLRSPLRDTSPVQ